MAHHHHHHHRRSSSIPTVRLSQPLPPLPITLDEIQARNVPQITIIPYHDDPSEDFERSPKSPLFPEAPENLPPSYEPMYDYLRSQQRPAHLLPPTRQTPHIVPEPEEPYRDEPLVITIDADQDIFQPPPPSYEELYIEHRDRRELQALVLELDDDAAPAEEICKFLVAMLFIAFTVAFVGAAFHWGKLGCPGPRC